VVDELCGRPLRLDAFKVDQVFQCDRPKGHGGRHASYEHGCTALGSTDGGDKQCELPTGHRGPHRATDTNDDGVPWTLWWANPDPEE
jgi:hypothetical protein